MAENDRKLKYFMVDVFTESPLKGNPLAVVMNTCALQTEEMQALAREFNLSETTFVERRAPEVEREDGVRVRIFTAEEELPFCGASDAGHCQCAEADCAGNGAGRDGDAEGKRGADPGAV